MLMVFKSLPACISGETSGTVQFALRLVANRALQCAGVFVSMSAES